MSPESQRIAIAEACGFVAETATVLVWADPAIREGAATGELPAQSQILYSKGGHWFRPENLPSYLSDLNAMHEAEKVLTKEQQREYVRALYQLTKSDFENHCATAAQRAEAFLRVKGKWAEVESALATNAGRDLLAELERLRQELALAKRPAIVDTFAAWKEANK